MTSTNKVNTLLGEIASASQEQADGIGQVNKGVVELDKVTQSNAGNAEELASASEETASQVQSLRALVGQFKVTGGTTNTAIADQVHQQQATTAATAGSTPASAPARRDDPKAVIPMDHEEGFGSF